MWFQWIWWLPFSVSKLISLAMVATLAGNYQIFRPVGTAARDRNDVIDMVGFADRFAAPKTTSILFVVNECYVLIAICAFISLFLGTIIREIGASLIWISVPPISLFSPYQQRVIFTAILCDLSQFLTMFCVIAAVMFKFFFVISIMIFTSLLTKRFGIIGITFALLTTVFICATNFMLFLAFLFFVSSVIVSRVSTWLIGIAVVIVFSCLTSTPTTTRVKTKSASFRRIKEKLNSWKPLVTKGATSFICRLVDHLKFSFAGFAFEDVDEAAKQAVRAGYKAALVHNSYYTIGGGLWL